MPESTSPTQTRQWVLANKPTDLPNLSSSDPSTQTFHHKTASLPSPLPSGHVLLQTLYLSNDPAQRGWISKSIDPKRLYVPPVDVGAPMRARGIAKVLEANLEPGSKEASAGKLQAGALVLANTDWSEYAVLPAAQCTPIDPLPGGLSETHYLGALGLTGLTAWYGLVEVVKTTGADVVLVSGAAGATGSMVVQIAKGMLGCKRVVGIAGGEAKCKWVREFLGADACVDYKKEGWEEELRSATEGGVDVFFDNVGGTTLDLALTRMSRHGRVAACGAVSNYNNESSPTGLRNWFEVVSNRIQISGFIVLDYLTQPGKAQEVARGFVEAVKAGKIKLTPEMETVVDTKFEDVPRTWMRLFEGANQGKLVTKLVS